MVFDVTVPTSQHVGMWEMSSSWGEWCRNSLLCGAVRGDLGLELEVTVEEGEVGKVDAE